MNRPNGNYKIPCGILICTLYMLHISSGQNVPLERVTGNCTASANPTCCRWQEPIGGNLVAGEDTDAVPYKCACTPNDDACYGMTNTRGVEYGTTIYQPNPVSYCQPSLPNVQQEVEGGCIDLIMQAREKEKETEKKRETCTLGDNNVCCCLSITNAGTTDGCGRTQCDCVSTLEECISKKGVFVEKCKGALTNTACSKRPDSFCDPAFNAVVPEPKCPNGMITPGEESSIPKPSVEPNTGSTAGGSGTGGSGTGGSGGGGTGGSGTGGGGTGGSGTGGGSTGGSVDAACTRAFGSGCSIDWCACIHGNTNVCPTCCVAAFNNCN